MVHNFPRQNFLYRMLCY